MIIFKGRKNFPLSFHGKQWFLLNCNNATSADIIQIACVNEELCYQFEGGRAHGEGIIDDGKYIFSGGRSWLNLHKGYTFNLGKKSYGSPFDFYSGGEPLIEGFTPSNDTIQPLNGIGLWKTQWQYLRASVYNPYLSQFDSLGLAAAEYQQARALGGMWGISGKWGDKNRLAEGNWHIDDSLLTTGTDSNAACFGICDDKNIPQYPIGLFPTAQGTLLVSWVYLKRVGFIGARRFLCAPEENIAIWGIQTAAQPNITDVILCLDPGMQVLYPNGIETTAFGCIPGGASAVVKSNFSPLRGKRVWLVLINSLDKEEVNYVIKTAAELRKNQIDFSCVQITGDNAPGYYNVQEKRFQGIMLSNCRVKPLLIPNLRMLAAKYKISIPDELSPDYHGDITELVNMHGDVPVVPGLLNLGDVAILNVRDAEIASILTGHFARSFASGTDLFPKLWENGKFMIAVFVNDVADENAKYLRGSGARICDTRFIETKPEERLKNFRAVIEASKIVIFAASGLWKCPEEFLETLRWCRSHDISAIILSNSENSNSLKYIHGKTITIDRIDGDTGITVAINAEGIVAVEACFNRNGKLLHAKALSDAKSEQTAPRKAIPSTPYNNNQFKELGDLSPEKKLAALRAKSIEQ